MKKIFILFIIVFCFASDFTLMFWNVENLFDISDDHGKKDGDFMPGGSKRYTFRAYRLKIIHLAQVINHINPDILAMVEVENRATLEALKKELKHTNDWNIIIENGPDIRGIDPALMYRKDLFSYVHHEYYPVFIKKRGYHSRSILRVDLAMDRIHDTLSVFINHWPSRRGGKEHSDPFRLYAAEVLLKAIDKTLLEHPNYRIILTGDFNDDKNDKCIDTLSGQKHIEYMTRKKPHKVHGTYYHEGEWVSFDHFLISNFKGSQLKIDQVEIKAPMWIREKPGHGPFRFYKGMEISGGYSDHFPVLFKFSIKRKTVE